MRFYLARKLVQSKGSNKGFLLYARLLSMIGIAVGTAGLLIALAVVHGFKETISNKIQHFGAPITISTYSSEPIYRADSLSVWLSSHEGVKSAWPVVNSQIVIQYADQVQGGIIQGQNALDLSINLLPYLKEGTWLSSSKNGLVLGAKLAKLLGVQVGDRCTLYALKGGSGPLNNPKVLQLPVLGIYETGIERFDDVTIFLPLEYARRLANLKAENASLVQLDLENPTKVNATLSDLREDLPFPYFAESLKERYFDLFSWIDLQEKIIPPIISVLIIVAAFNLVGAILMIVLDKSRHVGILLTLGMNRKEIQWVFIIQALWLSFLGWLLGIILFLLFHYLQTTYQLIPLDSVNYYMDYAPSSPKIFDAIIVTLVTFVLSLLAGWLPSRIAAKTDVVRVLRFSQT